MSNLPSSEILVDIYRRMTRIMQNDERLRSAMRTGRLVMPYYSGRGQECIPAAVATCLGPDDTICTTYRGIHDSIAKGVPLKELWAELAGKETGTCKGKGGPMHITHPENGIMVTTGIVGSSMPIANGLALASQVRGDNQVCVAYFGDGASNIGAFHEALNMASVWKLPVIFVCQNNRYAEHTKFSVGTSVANVAERSSSYGMPGLTVDGNEPVEVYLAASEAVERARAGGGPTLIEAMTFRFCGHNIGDDDSYMDEGEKESWMAKDPVPRYRSWLTEQGHATESQLAEIEAGIEKEIEEAFAFAMDSPYPETIELRRDVFHDEVSA